MMIKTLAPNRWRVPSRLLVAIAVGVGVPLLATAPGIGQQTKGGGRPGDQAKGGGERSAPGKPEVADPGDEDSKKAAVDVAKAKKVEPTEVWADPTAEALLTNEFEQLRGPARPLNRSQIGQVDNMATGQIQPDAALIKNYIETYAAELTDHRKIDAMLDPMGNPQLAEQYEESALRLISPLAKANAAGSNAFVRSYTKELIPVARKLLQNHLFARVEGMIALSRSGDTSAVPVFIEVLNDPKQPLAVKERAAVGLILVAQGGRATLDPGSVAIPAAKALTDFLENQPDAAWPTKFRALQALGAIRQSSPNPLLAQADFAATALHFLADPDAKPDVRAWAGWALGMFRYNRNTKVNFSLLAYHLGSAAADIGDQIVANDEDQPERSRHLSGLLLQLLEGLAGDPNITEAGLLRTAHPNLAPDRPFVDKVRQGVQDLSRAGLELSNSAGVQRPERRKALAGQVKQLRDLLAKSPPSSWSLVPGGPEFPGKKKAEVADGGKAE